MNLERGETRIVERVALDSNAPSEVGQVGLALNTMLDNVDDALAARQESETKVRQFVADASHELRNPLASIRGYAELTRRGRDELPPDTGFALSRIQSESERMSKLIDDLLLLARLDAGRDPNFEAVDVAELLVNAVSDAQAAGQDHEWSVTAPEEPVLVRADLGQLHQVLANLLSNARKHTPAGSAITARLRVSATAYGIDNGDTKNHAPKIPAGGAGTSVSGHSRLAVLTVTDDGPGIPADVIPTIFERFTRADTARSHSAEASTGLGLSIVAAVIAAHGGRVWAESKPGHTVFTVILPVMD
jgi:two-component system OmpR family sensor kinase